MSTSYTANHQVHLAIYDLSMGMARSLSAQFLGPQHAVEIIPHTAIVAFGKEYFFGQGIEWCSPQEFRAARGIHPIEVQPLGHTTCTEHEFESWCRAQAANGRFCMQSYDFFHRNCNNFSEEAAREGLRLRKGVPRWILELPQKFLNSPMGMVVRPMLEQMQITNNAPTNMSTGSRAAGSARMTQPTLEPSTPSLPVASADANPWANIPATTPTPATQPSSPTKQTSTSPILDNQTALLSTDVGVVKICIDRLKPDQEQCKLLEKLADTKATWTLGEINSVHQYLRSVIEDVVQHVSYALMLLRLVVLKQPMRESGVNTNKECSQSTQLVANLLFEEKLTSLANRSMAWCVLSNVMGSTEPPDWNLSDGTSSYKLIQVIDRALSDCDCTKDGSSSQPNVSLRQSAVAFLYNSSRYLTNMNGETGDADDNGRDDLSEGMMSILLGCLEHLHEETDVTTMQRLYMATGQLLKSRKFGKMAVNLVKDLGLVDEEISNGKNEKVERLAKEVSALLE